MIAGRAMPGRPSSPPVTLAVVPLDASRAPAVATAELAAELGRQAGNTAYVGILDTVARVVTAEKHIYPNVDLYSGAAYAIMGIPADQFTPIFALSRIAGWAAHVLEQHAHNRLIRPRAEYTGPTQATYVPISQR